MENLHCLLNDYHVALIIAALIFLYKAFLTAQKYESKRSDRSPYPREFGSWCKNFLLHNVDD